MEAWRGDKLPIDTADCGVPLRTVLTSASVHDSQVAIPLAMMTAGRVTNLYDLMDAAYDAREIYQMSERLGHVPIIDVNPRRDKDLKEERDREARARRAIGHVDPETVRVRIRSGSAPGGSPGAGPWLHRQSGVGSADDPPPDRQAQGGPDVAPTVRLVACRGDPE